MIAELIAAFKDEIVKYADAQINELKQSLDDGLLAYTANWYEKINNVKTFLFSENSVKFDEVYVPLSLRFEKKVINLPQKVESLFKINNCLTILGHAGSGKTMLMKHSFLNLLQTGSKIPIIIELRKIDNAEMTLLEYVSSLVFKLNLARNESIFTRLMGEGRFVFFLDGYDEIKLDNRVKRTSEIEEFVDRYTKNYYLLTSRPGSGAENLSRFRSYHVCGMDEKQVKAFVEKQARHMSEDGNQMTKKILETIFDRRNKAFMDYLQNPLLLSMFILTFKYNPEIPSRRSEFYFNVFDTLYCKHDTTSKTGGYIHEKKCKMEKDFYFKVLQCFSYDSYFSSRFEFDNSYINSSFEKVKKKLETKFDNDNMIYDLSVAIGIFVLDGLTYNFPHRSMQEYFAASLISQSTEDVRKTMYSKIMPTKYSYDGFNFWSLCQEMDEYCFLKYFVIKILEEFREKLVSRRKESLKDEETILYNYLDLIEIYISFSADGQLKLLRRSANLYSSVLKYSTKVVGFSEKILDWLLSSEGKNELSKLHVDNESLIRLDVQNEQIANLLKASSLPSIMQVEYNKMEDYITKLETDIELKKKREINLLNL